MNVRGREQEQTPGGKVVTSRTVTAIGQAETPDGTAVRKTPTGLAKLLKPFSLVSSAVIVAAQFILRITETNIQRITEEGEDRCIESGD